MASAATTTRKDVDSGTVKKTVTVIAYAPHGAYKSARDMADSLDPSTDYYERDYNRSREVEIVVTDDDGRERSEHLYSDSVRNALIEAADADGLPENTEVRVTEDVSRPYAHSPDTIVADTMKRLARELPDTLAGGVERDWWVTKWQDNDDVTRVRIDSGKLDHRKVLAHRSRRDGRRKWDTTRKHLSMSFTITLGPAEPDTVSEWNDAVVSEFVDMLVDEHWVERVRVADCTETVERAGDCFDI